MNKAGERFFNILEFSLFLALVIISFYLSWGVFVQFNGRSTSFKQSEVGIAELPTIVICFPHPLFKNIQEDPAAFGEDYNITYRNVVLQLGVNKFDDGINPETVNLTLLVTHGAGICSKLTSLSNPLGIKEVSRIAKVTFSEKLSEHWNDKINQNWKETYAYDIPGIHVYMTSEDNAYGIIYGEWPDGEFLGLNLGVTENSKLVRIRPRKQIYLSSTCREASFYQSFGLDYMSKNPATECNPFPMKNNETYPSCKTETQSQTVINAAYDSFQDYIGSGNYMKTCQKLEYKGQIDLHQMQVNDIKNIQIKYKIERKETLYEEYLIYDVIGMIGSVGGTLGLFTGLSFASIVTLLINFAKPRFQ